MKTTSTNTMSFTTPRNRASAVLQALPTGLLLDRVLPLEVVLKFMRQAVNAVEPQAEKSFELYSIWLNHRGRDMTINQAALMWDQMVSQYAKDMLPLLKRWALSDKQCASPTPRAMLRMWVAMVRERHWMF